MPTIWTDELRRTRFWAKAVRTPGGCWLWQRAMFKNGYGKVTLHNRTHYAHRLAYAFHYGVNPRKAYVCHRCDVRSCINPEHLFLGNALANVRDMHAKGRADHGPIPFGTAHHNAKLTEHDVSIIRTLAAWGMPFHRIGSAFGVSPATAYRACRSGWRHVP